VGRLVGRAVGRALVGWQVDWSDMPYARCASSSHVPRKGAVGVLAFAWVFTTRASSHVVVGSELKSFAVDIIGQTFHSLRESSVVRLQFPISSTVPIAPAVLKSRALAVV
jgi:hypothetical protein